MSGWGAVAAVTVALASGAVWLATPAGERAWVLRERKRRTQEARKAKR